MTMVPVVLEDHEAPTQVAMAGRTEGTAEAQVVVVRGPVKMAQQQHPLPLATVALEPLNGAPLMPLVVLVV
jgi:hypothetical protein